MVDLEKEDTKNYFLKMTFSGSNFPGQYLANILRKIARNDWTKNVPIRDRQKTKLFMKVNL